MAIVKRQNIDNTIIKELAEKYPPVSANNGVIYKQKLDYMTFELDFMETPEFMKLREKYGNDVIAVIFYFRIGMCNNGWGIRIDNIEKSLYLCRDCAYQCNIRRDIVNRIIKELIACHIFFFVRGTAEEGNWLTCPQQIYNYEMACNNRQQSRARNARRRARQAEQDIPVADAPPSSFDFEPYNNVSNKTSENTDNALDTLDLPFN